MIIAQLKDLPLQIKFPSVVKLIALKDLCWIASFGQHPRHIEKEHASREKNYLWINPSQRQNLLPTLEISNQNFKIFIIFKISEFFFKF